MSIRITNQVMAGTATAHQAWAVPDGCGWMLSWLPGRVVPRRYALGALVAAEALASCPPTHDERWTHIRAWMDEVDLPEHQWPWPNTFDGSETA